MNDQEQQLKTSALSQLEELEVFDDEFDREHLKKSFEIDKARGSYKIAEYLVGRYKIKTIGNREREVYIYQDGMYVLGLGFIRKWLHFLLEEDCKSHTKNEIIEKIKDLSATDREEFVVDERYINLNNGVFDLIENKLLPHSHKLPFLHKIPVNYAPETDCLNIKKFLSEILDEPTVATIQEFVGFGLYRRYFIKKALILVGEPNTGKTTLLRVISRLFGKDNISGISLQKITSDKFSSAHLYQKHINSFDDLSFRDINDTGAFKIVTGGGSITAEYKFGSQFQFENYAKLIFACNKIPDVKESDDEAYFSRWIIAKFNREVEKVDNFLIDKLTTPEEMSGFLNFAIEGLQRILNEQAFSYRKTPEETKEEMMQSGSSLAGFVSTQLIKEPEHWLSKDELYEAFKSHALENKSLILTKTNFGKKIRQYAPYIDDGKKTINKKQVTGWRNVAFSHQENQKEETEEEIIESMFTDNF